jgi:hypothetical protein
VAKMTIKQKTVYTCEFCKKNYLSKRFAELHEEKCNKNPENGTICFNECKFLEKKEVEVCMNHSWGGSSLVKRNALFCNKLQICLHQKYFKFPYDTMDYENEPLKKECDYFELKGYRR